MTRTSAHNLYDTMYTPLQTEAHRLDNPAFKLIKGFQYTQWCLQFAKWWLWTNTSRIKSFNQWENVKTRCSDTCSGTADDNANGKCMQCVFGANMGISEPFGLNYNVNNLGDNVAWNYENNERTNTYHVNSIIKLNQIFMHVDCLGRVVRGTRKDESANSHADHDWKVVFTNSGSNEEEVAAYVEDLSVNDIKEAHGTEYREVYMRKKNAYYYDTSVELWKAYETTSKIDGMAVSTASTQQIGQHGGNICTCPSGKKFKVGALIDASDTSTAISFKLQQAKNYYESCRDGVIGTSFDERDPSDVSNIELYSYGLRAVHCDVSGWYQNPAYLNEQCQYSDATKKSECLMALLFAAKKNRSQAHFYLSASKWTTYKHHKDKVHGAYSPCMYLHYRLSTSDSQDLSVASSGYFHDKVAGDDLKNTQFENRLGKWDDLMDKCLSMSTISGTDLCKFNNPWGSETWHGLDSTHTTTLNTIQAAYKVHLKTHCDAAPSIGETCATSTGTAEDEVHETMCQDAHSAEFVLDELAVLGVGCPLPKDRYLPPPPQPCWYAGEQNCPDPEVEQCDKIVRNMKKITQAVHLTTKMGECFNTVMNAQNIETKLRYFCVSQGIQDAAIASGDTMYSTDGNIVYDKNMGKATYGQDANNDTSNDDAIFLPGKPAYLQKVKATLKKLKEDDALDIELDWWNGLHNMATKTG